MGEFEHHFAANLRRLRYEAGMTQKELADKIGYSEKSISKWECGEGTPPLVTLDAIARLFHTELSAFVAGKCRYFLGIDGGGTKTELILSQGDRKIIAHTFAPGSNPIDLGAARAEEILKDAILDIAGNIPLSEISLFAGISGGTSGGMREELAHFFASLGFHTVRNGSDAENIVEAGLMGDDGIAVILGTGIVAFAKQGKKLRQVGGFGYLFDDGGSGFNLGRDAIAAHLRSLDGSGPKTLISEGIKQERAALLASLYRDGKRAIAAYAPEVFRAAKKGDSLALSIIERNADFAAQLIMTAASGFTAPPKLVLAGGLCNESLYLSAIQAALDQKSGPKATCLAVAPVMGALALAEKLVNQNEGE